MVNTAFKLNRRAEKSFLWASLWAAWLILGFVRPAICQVSAAYDVFLPPDHQLRRQLEDARTALEEREYNDAVRLLGVLLVGDADRADVRAAAVEVEDYFLEPPTEGAAQRSLKAEARRLLATLPKEGLDAYQLLYGHEADLMLQDAVKRGDVDALTEVTRKYFYTDAGYSAAMLLGRHYLSRGQPLAAALSLKQLHELPASRKFEPELSLLLSSSWLLAGQPELAERVLQSLRQTLPRAEVYIAGQPARLPAEGEDSVAWLRKHLGNLKLGGNAAQDQWFVYRGNAARNAPTRGGTPLEQERWAVPTPNDPDQQEAIRQQQEQYAKQRVPALPAMHPLVVRHAADAKQAPQREIVISRTPDRLLAVDFQTGERIWYYPHPPRGQDSALSEHANFTASPSGPDSPQAIKLKQRTWSDAPYGQISSDGERVYFVQDLGLADRVGPQQIVFAGGIIRRNPDGPKAHNSLIALDLPKEGSLLWTIGGEDGGDEDKLAGAFFLGPPLPLMDKLYALAEVNGDIRLVVVNPATGKLHWQQQLCGVDNQAILSDSSRRLGGAVPSFSEGVLICPTSAGAVVAVDVAKRSLLWGYQYLEAPEDARPTGGFFGTRASSRNKRQPGDGWDDASVTIVGDKVLLTPVEHDELICLHLVEGTIKGKPLWKRERGDGLYVACADQDRVILVEKHKVLALELESGKLLWELDLPGASKSMPSGRGFLTKNSYYLPLTSAELVKIDLAGETGEIAETAPTRNVLGNLICYRDGVISQGTTELTSFYQRDALGRIVDERLKADPEDAWALARHGELLLKEGKRREALASLRKSYELEPDDGTKARLVDSLLEALAEDFAGNQQLAVEAESLIDRPDQRAAFRRLMAEGLQQTGKHREAFEFYLKIVDDAASPTRTLDVPGGLGDLQPINEGLKVRPQRWIRSRMAQLLRAAGPEDREAMDAAIHQRLKPVLADKSITGLRHFVEFFGEHPAADAARLALAQRLWISGELLEAELILAPMVDSPQQPVAAQATAQMARLLGDAGHVEEAAGMYARLRDAFADVECGDGKTGRQVFEELAEQSAIAKKLRPQVQWPNGHVAVAGHDDEDNRGPKLGYSTYQHVFPASIQRWQGPHPEGARVVLDRNRRVFMRDGLGQQDISVQLNGAETTRSYLSNYTMAHGKLTGHLGMLALGYELFALDMMRSTSNSGQRLLWRENFAPSKQREGYNRLQAQPKQYTRPWGEKTYEASDPQERPIVSFTTPTHEGVCFRRWEQLVCVNPLRPETVHWVRDGIGLGADVTGDGEVILAIGHDSGEAILISALDGSELGRVEIGAAEGNWAKFGRRILRWNEGEDKSVTVAMLDPWDGEAGEVSGEPIWSHKFAAGAKGTLIEQDEAAVLEPSGTFTVIDLQSGKTRFQTKLEMQGELERLHVLRGRDEYIALASTPIEDGPDRVKVRTAPGILGTQGQHSPAVNGQIFALDRRTGESLWPAPAYVEHFGLPLDQPTQLPVLILMRNIISEPTSSSKWNTEIVCLDKRDGRIIFHKKDIPGETRVYRLLGDEEQKSAAIMLPGISYTLEWTDKPRPPQPPAQVEDDTVEE